MSLTVKKRQIVFFSLIVALAAAMYVNWYYTKPASESAEITEETTASETQQVNLGDAQYVSAEVSSEYFSEAQLKRSQSQDEAKQTLTAIIENENADESSKTQATEALEKLSQYIVLQSETESLIKAKTGGDVFVTLGDTAEIVLAEGTLTDETAVQIKDIITNKTDVPSEKITIIESK